MYFLFCIISHFCHCTNNDLSYIEIVKIVEIRKFRSCNVMQVHLYQSQHIWLIYQKRFLTIKYFKITQEPDILHIITETYLDVLAFLMKIFVFEFLPWKLLLCRYFLTTKKIKKSLYLFLWFKALEQLASYKYNKNHTQLMQIYTQHYIVDIFHFQSFFDCFFLRQFF